MVAVEASGVHYDYYDYYLCSFCPYVYLHRLTTTPESE